MIKISQTILFILVVLLFSPGCGDDNMPDPTAGDCDQDPTCDLTNIEYDPQPYVINAPENYPPMVIPADNPMTVAGVALGRHLFYDPILSADNSMSCGSCHQPSLAFTDGLAVSTGIDGIAGTRSSMPLIDIGYNYKGLFWDGRTTTLEEQALLPIEDPIEMHNTWPNVMEELRAHDQYPEMFRKAFGISNKTEMSKELAAKAIAQFERSMVSSGESRFDKFIRGNGFFPTEAELNGYLIFIDEAGDTPDGECAHCHVPPLFTTNDFVNNGIEQVSSLADFPDLGRGAVTGSEFDNGKFRIPTLRNIMHSAPFMHDGRFATIEEVMDHYISGGHYALNLDVNIIPHDDPSQPEFYIDEEGKQNLIEFMKMLTDTAALNNPAY